MTEREKNIPENAQDGTDPEGNAELIVRIPEDLYRAYHRCCWIVYHETGRERGDLAREMVTDFLVKNGC